MESVIGTIAKDGVVVVTDMVIQLEAPTRAGWGGSFVLYRRSISAGQYELQLQDGRHGDIIIQRVDSAHVTGTRVVRFMGNRSLLGGE